MYIGGLVGLTWTRAKRWPLSHLEQLLPKVILVELSELSKAQVTKIREEYSSSAENNQSYHDIDHPSSQKKLVQ